MSDLPFEISRGFDEIENSPFLVDDPDDKVGLAELEDMDGVGPSTAQQLRDAGIREPSDLYGLSQSQIASVDGIGPKKAALLRRQINQGGNRQDAMFRDDAIDKATKQHAERSEAAREADESFNAETSLSYQQWSESPNQYDMPGVDTVPRDRRLDRTKEAANALADQGLLESIEATASGPDQAGVSGLATAGTVKVKTAQNDPESTVAHELGHEADLLGGGPGDRFGFTNELFGDDSGEAETEREKKLREQGAELASRRRGISLKPEVVEERAEERAFAGGGFEEVFADAFAEMVEEPRRAKKEAPDLVRAITDNFREEQDGFYTPF